MRFNVKYFPNFLGQKKNNISIFNRRWENELRLLKAEKIKVGKNIHYNLNTLKKKFDKDNCKRTILIGGDHSNSIASLASVNNKYKNLKVLWIDAHGDINSYEKSGTKNIHGMVLAFLTNIDRKFNYMTQQPLKTENIMYLGIRDLDDYEKEIIENKKIKYLTTSEINENKIATYEKIEEFVGCDNLYISFDVDGLDPIHIPSTGTAVNGGININILYEILEKLLKKKNTIHLDIMELNLGLGNIRDKITSMNNVVKLLKIIKRLG
jgi:arginase